MRIAINTLSSFVDKDSGIKCKKAPPNRLPEAKLTSIDNILPSHFSFKAKNKIPMTDMALTKKVETKIKMRVNIAHHHFFTF